MSVYDWVETDEELAAALQVLAASKLEFERLVRPRSPAEGSILWVEGYKHTSYDPIDSIALRHRDRAAAT